MSGRIYSALSVNGYRYSALVVRDYSHHPKTHVCDIHFTTEFVGDQMIPAIPAISS